jgi:hypothetical protein
MDKNYFIVLDTSEGAYLSLDRSDRLLAFSTLEQAKAALELNYKDYLERDSMTWGVSAALHWITLRPFVIALNNNLSVREALTLLAGDDGLDPKIYSFSSVSVPSMRVVKVNLQIFRNYEVAKVQLTPDWQVVN